MCCYILQTEKLSCVSEQQREGRHKGTGEVAHGQTEKQRTCRNKPQSRERKNTIVHRVQHPSDAYVQVIQHRWCQEGSGVNLPIITANTFVLRQGAQKRNCTDGTIAQHRKCVRSKRKSQNGNQISKDVPRAVQINGADSHILTVPFSQDATWTFPAVVLQHGCVWSGGDHVRFSVGNGHPWSQGTSSPTQKLGVLWCVWVGRGVPWCLWLPLSLHLQLPFSLSPLFQRHSNQK